MAEYGNVKPVGVGNEDYYKKIQWFSVSPNTPNCASYMASANAPANNIGNYLNGSKVNA